MIFHKRYQKDIHDPQLRKYHAKGYTDPQTALAMGFSQATINKHRVALGLETILSKHRHKGTEYSFPIGEWPVGVYYEDVL